MTATSNRQCTAEETIGERTIMNAFKRVLCLVASLFGFAGLLACTVGLLGAWIVSTRLSNSTEGIFAGINESLTVAREKTVDIERRGEAATVKAEDLEQAIKTWAIAESGERLRSKPKVEETAQQVESALQQVDQWVELLTSSVEFVERFLSLARETGIPIHEESVSQPLKEIRSLSVQLSDAAAEIGEIRELTAQTADGQLPKDQSNRAVELTTRVIATAVSMRGRLGQFDSRLSETQERLEKLEARSLWWIRIIRNGTFVLLIWLAAGQVSLFLAGKRGLTVVVVRESLAHYARD